MRLGPGLLYEGRTLQGARPKLADFCSATMAEFYSAVDTDALTKITRMELVEKAGAQGTEFLMWMMMRGALGDDVTEITRNYHIPISNTAAGTLLLECAA